MNINTGELHENLEEALKEGRDNGKDLSSILMALDTTDYKMLQGMNRTERRRWAKKHKVKGN